MKDYKKLLVRLRAKLNISQEKLAILLNVSFATINRWENGVSEPSRVHMVQIEELCKKYKVQKKVYRWI